MIKKIFKKWNKLKQKLQLYQITKWTSNIKGWYPDFIV